jgi:hypothetical protein
LVELLQRHKESLQDISLEPQDYRNMNYDPVPLSSLREFSCLKRFDGNMGNWSDILLPRFGLESEKNRLWEQDLMDKVPLKNNTDKLCDRLPPSLETLLIHRVDTSEKGEIWDPRQLHHLVRNRHETLPNLKHIGFVSTGLPLTDHDIIVIPPLVQYANNNDDGFHVDIITPKDYERTYQIVFTEGW